MDNKYKAMVKLVCEVKQLIDNDCAYNCSHNSMICGSCKSIADRLIQNGVTLPGMEEKKSENHIDNAN